MGCFFGGPSLGSGFRGSVRGSGLGADVRGFGVYGFGFKGVGPTDDRFS